jgi:hypothetical protein
MKFLSLLTRTHLKSIFGRDTGQFRIAQGARAKVYLLILRVRSDTAICEIGRIPKGFCNFLRPLRYTSSEYSLSTPSSASLAGRRKLLKTRLEAYF